MLLKYLNPRNSVCYERILARESNKDILVHLINDILCLEDQDKLEILEYLALSQNPEIASYKQSVLDVLYRDGDGEHVIVPVQVCHPRGGEKKCSVLC